MKFVARAYQNADKVDCAAESKQKKNEPYKGKLSEPENTRIRNNSKRER